MGYVVTDRTPIRTGWRNYKTNPFAAAQMSGLGQGENPPDFQTGNNELGLDLTEPSSWDTISSYFAEANDAITGMEDAIREAQQAGIPFSPDMLTLANQTLQARQKYNSLAEQYSTLYRAVFGEQPTLPGLSGTLLIAGGVAAALVAIGLSVYALTQMMETVRTAWDASVQKAAIAKLPVGSTAQDIATVLNKKPPQSSDWLTWLQNNFTTVGLLLVAVTVGPSLIDSFGGKRRR